MKNPNDHTLRSNPGIFPEIGRPSFVIWTLASAVVNGEMNSTTNSYAARRDRLVLLTGEIPKLAPRRRRGRAIQTNYRRVPLSARNSRTGDGVHWRNKTWFRPWCSVTYIDSNPSSKGVPWFHTCASLFAPHETTLSSACFHQGVGLVLWVRHSQLLFSSPAIMMNRLFKNKRKHSPETPPQNAFSEPPLAFVTGASGTAIGSAERRNSCKGEF